MQVLLVLRIAWHRTLGWFVAGWACLMAVLGPWAAMVSQAATSPNLSGNDTAFLSLNRANMINFVVLVAWGIALRKNPAAHRRLMILTTIASVLYYWEPWQALTLTSSGQNTSASVYIPAYQEYPASGDAEPHPLPNFFIESVTVSRVTNFTLL